MHVFAIVITRNAVKRYVQPANRINRDVHSIQQNRFVVHNNEADHERYRQEGDRVNRHHECIPKVSMNFLVQNDDVFELSTERYK